MLVARMPAGELALTVVPLTHPEELYTVQVGILPGLLVLSRASYS